MVNSCGGALFCVHACGQLITEGYRTFNQHTFVQVVLSFFGRVFHLEDNTIRLQEACIPCLTTAFCVESRLVEHQNSFIASVQLLNFFTTYKQSFHCASIFQRLVTEEAGFTVEFQTFAIIRREVTRSACCFTLFLHRNVEAVFINLQVTFTRHIRRQVEREAVGVVEFERCLTRNRVTAHVCNRIVENRHPFIERFSKLLFFNTQYFLNMLRQINQFRIGLAHLLTKGRNQLIEEAC